MHSAPKPFLGDNVLPLSAFFKDSMIVQDYPEKYTVERNRPRQNHDSYRTGMSQGFVYGVRTNNGSNHWTRLVLFKPSEDLLAKWEEKIGSRIEAITINEYAKDPDIYRVEVSFMEGIGRKTLGFITASDYKSIKQAAWSKDLGEAI